MIEVGRVVVKIAGRDAGKTGVIIAVNGNRILVDGEVRRREVAIGHVEPTARTVEIAENASTDAVRKVLEPLGIVFPEPGKREHKAGPKPVKQRKSTKKAAAKPKKTKKAPAKKAAAKKASKSDEKTESKTPAKKPSKDEKSE